VTNLNSKAIKMKTHSRSALRGLEILESRLTPSSVTMTDPNGDKMKFTSSLGTLSGHVTVFAVAPDGLHNVYDVDLSDPSFNGTNFSVSVTKSKNGDGRAIVGQIFALTNDLGTVTINADLGDIDAGGQAQPNTAIKSLTVDSLGRFGQVGAGSNQSTILGDVPSLTVRHDIVDSYFAVSGNLASVKIGGSLIGGDDEHGGAIYCTGNLGNVSVKHDIIGGDGNYSGSVGAGQNLAGVTVGGSVNGGKGDNSGNIYAGLTVAGKIDKVTVAGSLVGGSGDYSAEIGGSFACSLGVVTIDNSVVGGSGIGSGEVLAYLGMLKELLIKGSLVGGSGGGSGAISAGDPAHLGELVGSIKISGSDYGGAGTDSGSISYDGQIGTLDIAGSIFGGSGEEGSGAVSSAGIKVLTIGGDVRGGSGYTSGSVTGMITTQMIGGAIIPGTGIFSGVVV
jgi:hypothetical protein